MGNALTEDGVLFTGNYVLSELFKENFEVGHYANTTYFIKKVVM
jgi:hypothetical protein